MNCVQKYVQKSEFLAYMESIAPRALAEEWDNPGLLIDCGKTEYRRIHCALELTEAVADEAAALGAELLVTHHPIMLRGIRRLDGQDAESRAILTMIKNGISLYAAHTNFDSAATGTNAYVAAALGLLDVEALEPANKEGTGVWGMGRVGVLAEPCTLSALSERVCGALDIPFVRAAGDPERKISRVAICTGAGDSLADAALSAGADVLVTGDVRHHSAAEMLGRGLAVIDAGHFETEAPAMKWLIDGLQARFNKVEYHTEFFLSEAQSPVLYTLQRKG